MVNLDLYYNKYIEKSKDFDNITILYDKKIVNLNLKLSLKDTIISKKDIQIALLNSEKIELDAAYVTNLKQEKKKTLLYGLGAFAGGLIVGGLLLSK